MQFLILSLASLAVAAPIFDYAPAHDNDESHGPHDQHDLPLAVPNLPLTSGSGLPNIGSESGALPVPHLPAVGTPGTSHALPFPEPHHESPLPLGPNFELPHSVGSADGGLPVPLSGVSHDLPTTGAEGSLPVVGHGLPQVEPGNIVGTGAGAIPGSPVSTVLTPADQAVGSVEGSVTGKGPVSTGGKPDVSAPLVNVQGGNVLGSGGVSNNLPVGDIGSSVSEKGPVSIETKPDVSAPLVNVQGGNILGDGTVSNKGAVGAVEGSALANGQAGTSDKPDVSAGLANVQAGNIAGSGAVSNNGPIANVEGSATGQGQATGAKPDVSGDLVDAQTKNGLVSGQMSASENDGFSAGASGVGNASFMGGESVSGQGSASGNGAASVSGAMSGSAATSGAQASSGKGDVSGSAAASGVKSAGDKPVDNTAEPYSPLISL